MAATRDISTKEKLLLLVDEIELISKELLESTIAPKQEKLSPDDQSQLIQLLLHKNNDLKETFQIAHEQGEVEEKMEELETEVNHYDQEIQTLQKHLKDAEVLLSTAIYQAKQKLDQMTKAQEHSVSSEELIKFSHRISATNAVAAPMNWMPGDPRRPYPTDLEMRMGFLGKLSEQPNGPPSILLDPFNLGGSSGGTGSPFPPWHPQSQQQQQQQQLFPPGMPPEMIMSNLGMTSGFYHHPPQSSPTLGVDPSTRNHEDVEVMSSDSSSSSSSDSQ